MEIECSDSESVEYSVIKITWAEVYKFCHNLQGFSIYGVPRGGAVIAGIAGALGCCNVADTPEEADIIIDDIIDSGATARKYQSQYNNRPFVALVCKQYIDDNEMHRAYSIFAKPGEWVQFPWEVCDPLRDNSDIVVRLLELMGEVPSREGLVETPKRFLKAMMELTSGYSQDPQIVLKAQFSTENYDEPIIVRHIEFNSLCEHHILPFTGHVHFAYIPGDKIVGLSKIARLVRILSHRLQVQERLTMQIADEFEKALQPKAVAVMVDAEHSCMRLRGAECKHGAMRTTAMRGLFKTDASACAAILARMG